MSKFFNISNHPSEKWSDEQKTAALDMCDEIVDVKFPNVDPCASTQDVVRLAHDVIESIDTINKDDVVHVMGESGLVYNIVFVLCREDIIVVHSTTCRQSKEEKQPEFKFVQFRRY